MIIHHDYMGVGVVAIAWHPRLLVWVDDRICVPALHGVINGCPRGCVAH